MPHLDEWERRHLIEIRIIDGLREIGVLLMAFTPLDALLEKEQFAVVWPGLLFLFGTGVVLFIYSVIGEWRLRNDD